MEYQIGGLLLMKKNELIRANNTIYRVLEESENRVLIIDCMKRTMPKYYDLSVFPEYSSCDDEEMQQETGMILKDLETLSADHRRFVREHFTLIAGILPFVADAKQRSVVINKVANEQGVSKQTIRNYLCLYLIYQDVSAFCPKVKSGHELTKDEKNIRWALNKYFYNQKKNSIAVAYTMMLKAKYCDNSGQLLPEHPSIHKFRRFEREHRSQQNYYISRNGLKDYQKNHRPLLGDGVQEYCSSVGIGMLDATILDIYLVNEESGIVGRPILTACIDGYSGLCCGYFLSWEGGMYSLRGLMLNIISDKVKHCRKYGINISKSDWNCDRIPATFMTDRGSEYISENIEQLTDLGISIVNLPSFRAELKSSVERFFGLMQDLFKPQLKGKGVIMPDFQQRGVRDYRKDACLTLNQFERILLHCIVYYNSQRVIESYPYTEDMIQKKVKPHSKDIFNYGLTQTGCNMLSVSKEELIFTLLPRVTGTFTRQGLRVNGLRYKNENYTEKYLSGASTIVAYNPEDVACVWLLEDGAYICFRLIESRYKGKELSKVQELQDKQKELVKTESEDNLQAKIQLASHIDAILTTANVGTVNIKDIRKNRDRERRKQHIDFVKDGGINA